MKMLAKAAARSPLCAVILLAVAVIAEAQPTRKVPRIGFLSPSNPNNTSLLDEGFRQGLRELGYTDGENILLEFRYAEGKVERYAGLVAELVQLQVDVLVVTALTSIRAAKQATKMIPVVMISTADPVAAGLIDSLSRPGGNITGLTRLTRELSGKRLELLRETIPRMSRVGVLMDANAPGPRIAFKEYESAALPLKVQLQSLEVRGPKPDFEGAFQAAIKGRIDALLAISGSLFSNYGKWIGDLAIKNRLPSMHERIDYVEAGGLMSYSTNDVDAYRRAAYYVDRILKGAKPADLPVEQPTKFEMVINLKTARSTAHKPEIKNRKLDIGVWRLTADL